MTERALFYKCIPQIAEMVVECRKMNMHEYEAFKLDVMESIPDEAAGFIGKVFAVIETELNRTQKAGVALVSKD